ncbi:HdeD family acid-resistance protein [Streptomyces sp. NPDC087300]|uniref:HdeD family acid-resistance protein n=1 Tax=Streptomyces sp. NPDC087300 TaxID=3365780 RepID=UPI00380E85CE
MHTATPPTPDTPPGPSGPDGPGGPDGLAGPLNRLVRGAWQYVLVSGVLALVMGVLALVWPGATLLVAGAFFGAYLLVGGIFQIVAAFGTHVSGAMRVLAFISGALGILLGLFCFRGAMQSILLLALWIGIGWLFKGITLTIAAVSDPDMPARGWQAVTGIVSVIAGCVLIVSPFDSVAILTVLGGCMLIAVGVAEIVTALQIRRRAKQLPHHV